jgi:protocatechuate 3,4-dioxygenase beta subunit
MNRALPVAVVLLLAVFAAGGWWLLQPPADLPAPAPDSGPAPAAATAQPEHDRTASVAPDEAPAIERVHAQVEDAHDDAGNGLLRVVATWDGEPAPGVLVSLRSSAPEHAYRVREQTLTNDEGQVTFADVAPGKWSLRSDRGDRHRLDVVPGPQDVAFELDAGVAVHGVVVDPEDRSVAGASVWLQTRDTGWAGGRVLTATDADGRFRLTHVPPHLSLGALADGFAPSPLVDLDTVDTSAPPAQVTLRLADRGGRIVGVVVDQRDRPVAGARVGAGRNGRHLDMRGMRVIERWSIRSTQTDRQGRFTLTSMPLGETPIACAAKGHGIWRSRCEVVAANPTELRIELLRAGTIHGTVTDGDGSPLAGALVRAYESEPGLSFLAGGQIDWDEMFGYSAAVTDADGRYEIEEVTAGTAHVFAQPGGRSFFDGPVPHARTELEVPPAGRVEWSPEVTEGRVVEGVVYYRDGHPMKNVFVTLTDERSGRQHTQTNNDEGVFRFVNLDDSSYTARVQMWDAPKDAPPLQASGLRPDRGRAELRATHDKPVKKAPGTVIGRIDDPGLRIRNPKAVTVTLSSAERWFRDGGKIVDGAFRFERVTPCRFRLTLMENEAVLAHSDWFELEAGAQLDTGVLRTVPGGSVRISAQRDAGANGIAPTLYLRHDEAPRSTSVALEGDEVLVDNLTPGHYQVTGYGKGLVAIKGEVTVEAGRVATLPLRLQGGTLTRFSIWVPTGEAVADYVYRIVTADGAVFREVRSGFGSAPTRPFPVAVTIPPGRYTMEFRAQEVLVGTATFTVGPEPTEDRIRIDLKRD